MLASIAAIALVGTGLSLTIPLIAMRMETAGYSGGANGLSTAIGGLGTLLAAPATPPLARKLGMRRLCLIALSLIVVSLVGLAAIADVIWWFPLRFVLSAALTILFVISEYAINALAPPRQRGLWIGVYSMGLGLGFIAGPVILGLFDANGNSGFYLAIALALAAGLPFALYAQQIPALTERPGTGLFGIAARAPLLMMSAFVFGMVETGGMALLPVHGLRNGYDAHTSALLVAAIAAGYAVFQTPLGMLADRMSKRALLCAIAALGLIGALALIPLTRAPVAFFVGLFIWGGIVSGLYMVALAALGHDYDGADLAAANAAFISLYALGMLAGPPAMGAALDASAPAGLFLALAAVFVLYLIAAVFLRKPVAKPVVDS